MAPKRIVSALLIPAALVFAGSAQASFNFDDPGNVTTVDVNSNATVIDKSAGNISIGDFNDLSTKYVFTLDTTRTGVSNDNLPAFLNLTNGASGIDLNATINASGGGFAVFTTDAGGTYTTSGTGYIATTRATVTIDITQGVAGVAFTINRLIGDATITLFDADSNPVGDAAGYTITGGASHGFFGFLGGGGDNPIAQVVVTTGGGNQLGIDDVSFTNVPEPGSMGLIAAGLLMIAARRRRA